MRPLIYTRLSVEREFYIKVDLDDSVRACWLGHADEENKKRMEKRWKLFNFFATFLRVLLKGGRLSGKQKKEMGRKGVSDERLSTRNIFLNFRGQVVRQGREEMKKSSKKSESFFIQFSDVEFYRGTLSLSLDDSYDISSRKIRN